MIHWIECNGRWGGVSIPMTAASRLIPAKTLPAIAIAQEILPEQAMSTQQLKSLLADLLFRHGKNGEGLIIMSPPESRRGTSINLLAIATTQSAADDLLTEAMQRLAAVGRSAGSEETEVYPDLARTL